MASNWVGIAASTHLPSYLISERILCTHIHTHGSSPGLNLPFFASRLHRSVLGIWIPLRNHRYPPNNTALSISTKAYIPTPYTVRVRSRETRDSDCPLPPTHPHTNTQTHNRARLGTNSRSLNHLSCQSHSVVHSLSCPLSSSRCWVGGRERGRDPTLETPQRNSSSARLGKTVYPAAKIVFVGLTSDPCRQEEGRRGGEGEASGINKKITKKDEDDILELSCFRLLSPEASQRNSVDCPGQHFPFLSLSLSAPFFGLAPPRHPVLHALAISSRHPRDKELGPLLC